MLDALIHAGLTALDDILDVVGPVVLVASCIIIGLLFL